MPRNLLIITCVLFTACTAEKDEPECPTDEPVSNTKILKKAKPDGDWCRVCVMGRKWASCQTARAENEKEQRAVLEARAVERACSDAGYKKEDCTESVIISRICKGERKPRSAESAEALQKVFFENLKKQEKAAQ